MRLIFALCLAVVSAMASTVVTVTYDSPNGVNNGVDYVLPYNLTVDGSSLSADCYDFFDTISTGETWQANEYTLAEAASSGIFSGQPNSLNNYELVGVMAATPTTTQQSQIDLQQAMWNVFDPGAFAVTSAMAADTATAESEISGFDFSGIRYLEPVITGHNEAQAFAFVDAAPTPESATGLIMAAGLIRIGIWRRKRA